MNKLKKPKDSLYAGIVWIISAIALLTYGATVFFETKIPGVEDLVNYISNTKGVYIYIFAFISIFIEGLYVIGSFFPGSSLVLVFVVFSGSLNPIIFALTMTSIFAGWVLAGIVNIVLSKFYHLKVAKLKEKEEYQVTHRFWTTWFPAFRSNHEVAQITEGANPLKVFWSSVKVKLVTCIFLSIFALIVPLFIDINNVSNEEGLVSLLVVAVITLTVGVVKVWGYYKT